MQKALLLPAALLLSLSGCATKPQPAASAPAAECAPLPGTRLCQTAAAAFLPAAQPPKPPAGCSWEVNEVEFVDEYVLYRAAKCNGKVTKLEYAGGAHMAQLNYAVSAYHGGAAREHPLVQIASADPGQDLKTVVLSHAREAMNKPAEAAKCSVRAANSNGWPADALVVDISAAEAAKVTKDEPRSACGPMGLDEDTQAYWRTFQGYAWFFDLGQDEVDFDPASFTIIKKDGKGGWVALPR